MIVKHHVVMDMESGCAVPMNWQNGQLPHDFTNVFGPQLPNEVYLAVCHGLMSPDQLNGVCSGTFLETAPLEAPEMPVSPIARTAYEHYVTSTQLNDLRRLAMSVLPVPGLVRQRQILGSLWFSDVPMNLSVMHDPPVIKNWKLDGKAV